MSNANHHLAPKIRIADLPLSGGVGHPSASRAPNSRLLASSHLTARNNDLSQYVQSCDPRPPQPLVDAAIRELPPIFAAMRPNGDGEFCVMAAYLYEQMSQRGHPRLVAEVAIHDAIAAGLARKRIDDFKKTRQTLQQAGGLWADALYILQCECDWANRSEDEKTFFVATQAMWDQWQVSVVVPDNDETALAASRPTAQHEMPTADTQSQGLSADASPQPETSPPFLQLLKVFSNNIADDRFKRAAEILADDTLSTNEKLTQIDRLIYFPASATAEQLAGLFGVKKQAVLKTKWWKENRKGKKADEIARRHEQHQERSDRADLNHDFDDD